jgi:hypothetical protein
VPSTSRTSATRSSSTTTSPSGSRSATAFWPAVYLVDGDGRVRFHHFGEGNYEETERAIQQLLAVDEETVRVEAGGIAEAADLATVASPGTYVGFARGQRRARARVDALALNQSALDGAWSVGEEEAVLGTAGGSMACCDTLRPPGNSASRDRLRQRQCGAHHLSPARSDGRV